MAAAAPEAPGREETAIAAAPLPPSLAAYLEEHGHAALRVTCVLCAVMMPAAILLDLTTVPELAMLFLGQRSIAAVLAVAVFFLARRPALRRHSYALSVLVIVACAISVEANIVRSHGVYPNSPHYVGLNLCVLGAGLIFVWTVRQTLLLAALILLVWLLPSLFLLLEPGGPGDKAFFLNNLVYIVMTGIVSVVATKSRYNLVCREFAARHALAQTTSELQASLLRIRQLDQAKSTFFANVSHELRTPLTLITTPIIEALRRQRLPEALRATLSMILRNTQRLHRLIDGLLDLSRLEAGRLRLRLAPVDLPALVSATVAAFRPTAESQGIRLHLQLDPFTRAAPTTGEDPTEPPMQGDVGRLEVVIHNLLSNALKFTDDGGEIALRLSQSGDHAVLQVRDSGIGIAAADLPHLFERFRRVEAPQRYREGSGIGLALVKELTELHGGRVSVESEPGRGSCFTVRLPLRGPLAAAAAALWDSDEDGDASGQRPRPPAALRGGRAARYTPAPERAPATDGEAQPELGASVDEALPTAWLLPGEVEQGGAPRPRILVAEDNEDLRALLCDLLRPSYQVQAVPDGRAALAAVRESPPDLVLADVMMPELTGFALCQALKADPRSKALPVVLLTARSGMEQIVEGFRHGADDYLVKPFHPQELLARLGVQIKLRRLYAQVASASQLAAVGTLAAGVAHEIKNPLNAVRTGVAALRRALRAGRLDRAPVVDTEPRVAIHAPPPAAQPVVEEVLEMLDECVGRIAQVTTALTDHSRPADGAGLSEVDLQKGVESAKRLLADRLRRQGVEVTLEVHSAFQSTAEPPPRVLARPGQINQVILNLLDNALHESPAGGRIHVALRATAARVTLSVRDEGRGLSAESQGRLFQPFFTTRPVGEGTGLGLYVSRQIVEAHGGVMHARSAPGEGAEFLVELPRADADPPEAPSAAAASA